MKVLELPFDIYQRYKLMQEALEILRANEREVFKILDAGGGGGPVTGFLPNDAIRIVDQGDCDLPNYQKADVLALPFKDQAFDIVLSADVLEHIPPDRRERFLRELWRVGQRYILLAAPFDSAEAVQAEKVLFEFVRTKLGYEHHFLKEHRDHGLPGSADTRAFFESLGADTVVLPNGLLSHWLPLMMVTYYLDADTQWAPLSRLINSFYNEFYYRSDNCEPAYRRLIIASKQPLSDALKKRLGRLAAPAPRALDFSPVLPLAQFFQLELIQEKTRQIKEDATQWADLKIHAGDLERAVQDREARIAGLLQHTANLEGIIRERNEHIASLEQRLATNVSHVANLNDVIRDKERQVAAVFQEKDRHIEEVMKDKDRHIKSVFEECDQRVAAIIKEKDAALASLSAEHDLLLQAKAQRIDALSAELEPSRAELGRSRTELGRLRADLDRSRAELGQTLGELDQARADLEQARSDLKQLSALDRSRAELEQSHAELEQARVEVGQLRAELKQVRGEFGQTRTDLEHSRAEFSQTHADLEKKEQSITALKSMLTTLTAELDKRDRQIHRLQDFESKVKRTLSYKLYLHRRLNSQA